MQGRVRVHEGLVVSDGRSVTVCLAMIVKNESAVIARCLESAIDHIDSWVIVDTGSADDTCQQVEEILGGLPGRLEHREFVDFGHNRTELMELAYRAEGRLVAAPRCRHDRRGGR